MTSGVPSPLRARMAGAARVLMRTDLRPSGARAAPGGIRECTGAEAVASEDGASLRELRHPRRRAPAGAPGLHGPRAPRRGPEHGGDAGAVVHLLHHAVPAPRSGVAPSRRGAGRAGTTG